jgi:hypothetical protein
VLTAGGAQACLDGEEAGWLAKKTRQIHDPIRLVRMVKEITAIEELEASYSLKL